MSNIPLLFGKDISKIIIRLNKAKTFIEKIKLLSKIRPSYFKPVSGLLLGLTDPVCGLNMGSTAEILAKEFAVSREAQDEFSLMSHKRAIEGREKLSEEIVPVIVPGAFDTTVTHDNGPREHQTMEALSKLKPFFDKYTGTVTAGNSSQITDGACALLMMDSFSRESNILGKIVMISIRIIAPLKQVVNRTVSKNCPETAHNGPQRSPAGSLSSA